MILIRYLLKILGPEAEIKIMEVGLTGFYTHYHGKVDDFDYTNIQLLNSYVELLESSGDDNFTITLI